MSVGIFLALGIATNATGGERRGEERKKSLKCKEILSLPSIHSQTCVYTYTCICMYIGVRVYMYICIYERIIHMNV